MFTSLFIYSISFLVILIGIVFLFIPMIIQKRSKVINGPINIDQYNNGQDIDNLYSIFNKRIDEDASGIPLHLDNIYKLAGPDNLKIIVERYQKTSKNEVRKELLGIFTELYISHTLDEENIEELLEKFDSALDSSDMRIKKLANLINDKCHLKFALYKIISELFSIINVRVIKLKEPMAKLRNKYGNLNIDIESHRPEFLKPLKIITSLVENLSEHLPHKNIKDKIKRRKALLICINDLKASWTSLKESGENEVEARLLMKIIKMLVESINDFIKKSGGTPVGLEIIEQMHHIEDSYETWIPTKKRYKYCYVIGIALIVCGCIFIYRHNYGGLNIEKISANTVQIKCGRKKGTGFFINEERFIVTNYHILSGKEDIIVSVKNKKKKNANLKLQAKIIRFDESNDIALLEIKDSISSDQLPSGLEVAREFSFKVGQTVHVLGNPLDLDEMYTRGAVSAIGSGFAYMDVTIDFGNSGGPVCNDNGVVIGVTTAKIFSDDFGVDISKDRSFEKKLLSGLRLTNFGVAVSSKHVWNLMEENSNYKKYMNK